MSGYSLRRRLLLGLTLAAALIGVVALADTWREAVRTSQGLSDRVLEGSALAIAERVTVDEGGGLEADIPFAALEMLASAAEDQVFYRVDAPAGQFLTGYEALAVLDPGEAGIAFADGLFGEVPIRSATLEREISTGATSHRLHGDGGGIDAGPQCAGAADPDPVGVADSGADRLHRGNRLGGGDAGLSPAGPAWRGDCRTHAR